MAHTKIAITRDRCFQETHSSVQEKRQRITIQLYKFCIRKMTIIRTMGTQRVVPNSGKSREDLTKKQIHELGVERQKSIHIKNGGQGVEESSVSWRRKTMSRAKPQVKIECNILGMKGSGWRNMPAPLTQAKSFACCM